MEISFSSHFLRRAQRLSSGDLKTLSERIEYFRKDVRDPRLKTHALTGKLKGYFSFSLTHGKRVKFLFVGKNKALFIDVGSNNDVYIQ